jgi:uncharacterized protein (UPF0212 family)
MPYIKCEQCEVLNYVETDFDSVECPDCNRTIGGGLYELVEV